VEKNNYKLTIITAYRPNPPSAGVMGVYAQHSKHFNEIDRKICPREAFLIDLQQATVQLQDSGSQIILMLDGNEDMHRGKLAKTLTHINLQEAILQ
jgi:hypothetical protein